MSILSWFRKSSRMPASSARKLNDQRYFKPKVETLEDRVVPAGALNDHTVLILGSSLNPDTPGAASIEAQELTARGFTVEIASDAQWLSKSAANFASYRALVIGDQQDFAVLPDPLTVALANVNTWTSVVNGQEFLTGADPEFHAEVGNNSAGATLTIQKGVDFAAASPGRTGLYFAFGGYFTTEIQLVLNKLGSGFTVVSGNGDNAHVVASVPSLAALTDAALTGWGETFHRPITQIPTTFTVFAVDTANDQGEGGGVNGPRDVIVIRQNLDLTGQIKQQAFFFNQIKPKAPRTALVYFNLLNTGPDIIGDFTVSFSVPYVQFLSFSSTGHVKASGFANGKYFVTISGGLKRGQSVGIYSQFTYAAFLSLDNIRKQLHANITGDSGSD